MRTIFNEIFCYLKNKWIKFHNHISFENIMIKWIRFCTALGEKITILIGDRMMIFSNEHFLHKFDMNSENFVPWVKIVLFRHAAPCQH